MELDKEQSSGINSINILVTGGTGFLGFEVIKLLKQNPNFRIFVLVREQSNHMKLEKTRLNIIKCDIQDKKLRVKINQKIDIIIHLAAIREHFKDKNSIYQTNFLGTKNLINLFPECKQFIFSSSVAVLFPKTFYANTKNLAEEIIRKNSNNYTILRIGPIFGREDNSNISKLIKMIQKGKIIPIPGNGNVIIQPIHVEDVSKSIEKVIMNSKYCNKIFYIVGEPISFENFITKVCEILNKKKKIIHVPFFLMKIFVTLIKFFVKNPIITPEQIDSFKNGNLHLVNSDFDFSLLDESIKKTVA